MHQWKRGPWSTGRTAGKRTNSQRIPVAFTTEARPPQRHQMHVNGLLLFLLNVLMKLRVLAREHGLYLFLDYKVIIGADLRIERVKKNQRFTALLIQTKLRKMKLVKREQAIYVHFSLSHKLWLDFGWIGLRLEQGIKPPDAACACPGQLTLTPLSLNDCSCSATQLAVSAAFIFRSQSHGARGVPVCCL